MKFLPVSFQVECFQESLPRGLCSKGLAVRWGPRCCVLLRRAIVHWRVLWPVRRKEKNRIILQISSVYLVHITFDLVVENRNSRPSNYVVYTAPLISVNIP